MPFLCMTYMAQTVITSVTLLSREAMCQLVVLSWFDFQTFSVIYILWLSFANTSYFMLTIMMVYGIMILTYALVVFLYMAFL